MASPPVTIRTETTGPLVTGIAIGFVCAAALFVAGRFYTRQVILGYVGKDDWSMLVATVCLLFLPCASGRLLTDAIKVFSVVNSLAMCFEVKYGMGQHSENVTPEEGLQQLKVGSSSHSMATIRVSLLTGGPKAPRQADTARPNSSSWLPS
jgi:hypothetical protein